MTLAAERKWSWPVRIGAAMLFSGFAHVAMMFVVDGGPIPEPDFEFAIPMDLELGLSSAQELEVAAAAAAAANPAGDPASGALSGAGGDAGVASDASADAGVPTDAGRRDGGRPSRDAGADTAVLAAGDGGTATARIPEGAQIALRIDLKAIGESELAADTRTLLETIPDWRLLLEGSGIDPLVDLERVMIATPNLQRENLVIAGRHTHVDEPRYVQDVVERFHAAEGSAPNWRTVLGLAVADWPNHDDTARVVAMLDPLHFVLCRERDLERVLALAMVRAEAEAHVEGETSSTVESAAVAGPEALLSMPEGQVVTLDVDGVRNFLRRGNTAAFPERGTMVLSGGTAIAFEGDFVYPTAEEAAGGAAFWSTQRDTYAGSMFVQLAGFGSALRETRIEPIGDRLEVHAPLSVMHVRKILGFLTGSLASRERRNAAPAPAPAPASAEVPAP